MTEPREITEHGEQVNVARPSWGPAFFVAGLAVVVCGIYAQGFMVRGWIYSIIGAIVLLFAFRSLVKGAIRDFYRLPRKQTARGAVLPVETISVPRD
jgi:hypothetical protein